MECTDEKYRLLRATLPTRKTFFDDVRALTCYRCLGSRDDMMDFMLKGLEVDIPLIEDKIVTAERFESENLSE